ncbi:phosphatidylinositol-3,4,5-trisphosphate 3-phosphatase PTEN [Cordyceps fumosorosea ARSEF 2679]|uniref:phosphatidylinositol-3,4,5-trisphosphate 3-phosphatase n=1 Tax=Cordyceps fumosorosea (strain ARSEF 2679) TaxID=1081104 RepID=A0A167RL48_CORFA|nr:phosphatidylinositol-3,4,5-trisphosphate 3-phosphatase PTEN [Cordyceps fumosorosea ARSEF 2679]OAA58701.1 phosphatidylinositol-3,4,5-trisphosphate 3-phosphatase PTEN [Cordyceps fumosorosea ARSEF 2679]
MASFLRQLVAGPRKGHPEAGLDLCYVTDHIIATSGPSHTYPKRAYRNPLDQLVAFLDARHGADWAIWEFRAEGAGYPDHLVYDRVCHFPFPDHHPPPFALMPRILASMRRWLHGGALDENPDDSVATTSQDRDPNRVVVVHCKAGKGRSGTASVSYLVAEEGWTAEEALARFTERRMRPRFGAGVSIPSQLRWVRYVERWSGREGGRRYVDRPVEVLEVHAWGLRDGVKVEVEGFADGGRRIHTFHTFRREERHVVRGDAPTDGGFSDIVWEMAGYPTGTKAPAEADFADATNNDKDGATSSGAPPEEDGVAPRPAGSRPAELIIPEQEQNPISSASRSSTATSKKESTEAAEPGGMAVIFRPATPIRVPNSDVNIAVERRNRTHKSIGLTVVSAVAHVWFNAFFEDGDSAGGGVFTIDWDAMDGIKGTGRKGSRALDKLSVVWRFADEDKGAEAVAGDAAAAAAADEVTERDIGVRVQSPASADISRASSVRTAEMPPRLPLAATAGKGEGGGDAKEDAEALESVKTSDPSGAELQPGETNAMR